MKQHKMTSWKTGLPPEESIHRVPAFYKIHIRTDAQSNGELLKLMALTIPITILTASLLLTLSANNFQLLEDGSLFSNFGSSISVAIFAFVVFVAPITGLSMGIAYPTAGLDAMKDRAISRTSRGFLIGFLAGLVFLMILPSGASSPVLWWGFLGAFLGLGLSIICYSLSANKNVNGEYADTRGGALERGAL